MSIAAWVILAVAILLFVCAVVDEIRQPLDHRA